MKIIQVPLHELKRYENNPRNNTNAVEAAAKSIKEFGFKVPIIVDRDNVIVAGHTRALAAALLGMVDAPCIVADDLTPEQVQAFRLADNKTAEMAGWSFAELDAELANLSIDMSQFGFTLHGDVDLNDLFGDEEKDVKTKTYHCQNCGQDFEA